MKVKTFVIIWLAIAAGLFICFQAKFVSAAPETPKSAAKIGIVNIQKIFKDSKKTGKYRDDFVSERTKIEAELEKAAKEIEADKAGLKTLKVGSNDYLAQIKDIMTKQANSQAEEKFYEQQMNIKEQQMVETIYQQVLEKVKKVAEAKKLDVVLTQDEIDFPAMNLSEATMMIRTHKVLYSNGCTDITNDVLAELDSEK